MCKLLTTKVHKCQRIECVNDSRKQRLAENMAYT